MLAQNELPLFERPAAATGYRLLISNHYKRLVYIFIVY